mmetsp:Transcript_23450/g.21327  ORF Transcript_23450/g.21327 Transcript_23450/m.21327 type:complete len:398 (-) Transcript_23450:24-1217(-)
MVSFLLSLPGIVIVSIIGTIYGIVITVTRILTLENDNIYEPLVLTGRIAIAIPLYYIVYAFLDKLPPKFEQAIQPAVYMIEILLLQLIMGLYRQLVAGPSHRPVDLKGKVYIITGSNTGIGFETAKEIVKMGATVVLACRSTNKAEEAKNKIISLTKCQSSSIIVIKLDLCGFDSTRKFVKDFKSLKLPLHGLINNAGVMMQDRNLTQDGFEMVFTANHLSHFLLTLLLLPELKKSNGRIVNLTSSLHKSVKRFDFNDIMSVNNYSLFGTYSQSKLANVMFTLELQRRLNAEGSKVTCNAVHPGIVRTEVTRHMNIFMRVAQMIVSPILILLQKSPLQGASTSIYVATDPSLEGIGGKYFFNNKIYPPNKSAEIKEDMLKLWEISEKLTGLSDSSHK